MIEIEEIEDYLKGFGYAIDIFEANESEETGTTFCRYRFDGAEYSLKISKESHKIRKDIALYTIATIVRDQIEKR